MAQPKRFEEYPQLARQLRKMSPEGRELVAVWHRVLNTALDGFIPHAKREVKQGWGTIGLQKAATGGAEAALLAWLDVMRKIAALIADPSEGDWCCKVGMMTHPHPCPQHGYHPDLEPTYPLGTLIRRPYGEGIERAVKVYDDSDNPHPWRSIEFPMSYNWKDLSQGTWTVMGYA